MSDDIKQIFSGLYADTYDAVYREKEYGLECDFLEAAFRSWGNGHSILEFGCGTGNHAKELARRGYELIGIDCAPAMIEKARQKNIPNATFIEGDIRDINLAEEFDFVVMMFNVIGYLHADAEITAVFNTAKKHLNPGGLFIFDYWDAGSVRAGVPTVREAKHKLPEGWLSRRTSGQISRVKNEVSVKSQLTLNSSGKMRKSVKCHNVRVFEAQELRDKLNFIGFTNIFINSFPKIDQLPSPENWSLAVIAQI